MEHYARQRRIWLVLILIFSLFAHAGHSLFGTAIVFLFWMVLGFGCWLESYNYIKSRTDLFDGKKYAIVEKHGDKFLVAVMDQRVVGTISYKERDDCEITFAGVKRPPCLEIFSLSVSKNARGHGIGVKLCDHVEQLARTQNRNLYLETSMAQLPAQALYRKLGYRSEPQPRS